MIEQLINAKPFALIASMILVGLSGCATGVPGDHASSREFVPRTQEQVPCAEGLALRPGDSCVHEGGRFWVEEDGRACYSGRYLGETLLGTLPEFCSMGSAREHIDGLCLTTRAAGARPSDCSSDAFGVGAERVAGTSNWQVSQVREVRHVEWDGQAIRVEGTSCRVTLGTSSRGACLRLQISPPGGACIISDYGVRRVCERLDITLLKNGEQHTNSHTECERVSSRRYSPVVCEAGE